MVLLVDYVNEIVSVHDGFDQVSSWRVRWITLCPIIAKTIRLVLKKSDQTTGKKGGYLPRQK